MAAVGRMALVLGLVLAPLGGAPSWSDDVFDQPGVSVGMAFAFGGSSPSSADVGLTAKIISNRHENNPVLGAGVTFYPWAEQKFGVDVGAGYNFTHVTPMLSYDFLQKKVQLSTGWSNTKQSRKPAPGPQACVANSECSGGEICLSGICTLLP